MKRMSVVVTLVCSVLCGSCTFLDNVANNITSIANLANCEYSLKNVSNVSVAGVNVKNVASGSISATDVVKLVSAITTKSVPLTLDVNINVKNPTENNALLATMDWALDIATKEFVTGVTSQSYNIAAKKTTAVPLGVSTDLYSLFSRDGLESLKAFAGSFTNQGTSSELGLRIRPSISVAGQTYKSPTYIQIMKPTSTGNTTTGGSGTPSGVGVRTL